MDKCNNPNCEKILIHIEGRRKKKYCSATCRNKISMATFLSKPKELKTIRITIEEYNRLVDASKMVVAQKTENKPKEIQKDISIVKTNTDKHPLWKQDDPKENSGSFYLKYNCFTYEELKNLK